MKKRLERSEKNKKNKKKSMKRRRKRREEEKEKGEGGLKEGLGYNRKEEKGEKKRRISAWKGGWPTINFQT